MTQRAEAPEGVENLYRLLQEIDRRLCKIEDHLRPKRSSFHEEYDDDEDEDDDDDDDPYCSFYN